MKKADETSDNIPQGSRKRKPNKAFRNFSEYWHFVKNLPEHQRKLLVNSMSRTEQKALKSSYDDGGWEDLFMRNACDEILDVIKNHTKSESVTEGIDLLDIRMKILSGRTQLMHQSLWTYVQNCFKGVPFDHIAYIFDGIIAEEHDADYVKLSKYEE